MTDGEEEVREASLVPVRGRKRNGDAIDSIENDAYFAGFARLPLRQHTPPNLREVHRRNIESGFPLPPLGDGEFARAKCASLPSTVSDGARKLFFELLTRPQFRDPAAGISLDHITRDTGLRHLELGSYAHELEQLGKARQTGPVTWLPAGLSESGTSEVDSRLSHSARLGPEPSESQVISCSGFAILPSAVRGKPKHPSRRGPPAGDAALATAACAALPPSISDGAKKTAVRPYHEGSA